MGCCPHCGEWNTVSEISGELSSRAGIGTAGTGDALSLATTGLPVAGLDTARLGVAGLSETGLGLTGEVLASRAGITAGSEPDRGLISIVDVRVAEGRYLETGIGELDRVMGGGFVEGSVTLVAGEPGIGKSTLFLQAIRSIALRGQSVLLISAEESASQVTLRALRLGELPETLLVLDTRDITGVAACIREYQPSIVIVDSIQAMVDPSLSGMAGSINQVKACADLLIRIAKITLIPFVIVGHVTKDGTLAGPKVLEHMVDTVLIVEGDRHHALRSVSAIKHRFGAVGETGLFCMESTGMVAVDDPYDMLLGDRPAPSTPGSVVFPMVRGGRPLLVEIQALASKSSQPTPRRIAKLVDAGRFAILLAVLENHVNIPSSGFDQYVSAVGGIKVYEPAGDLAMLLAMASALRLVPFPFDAVAIGEVGLAGEIRRVPYLEERVTEARRLGFKRAILPASSEIDVDGIEVIPVSNIRDATSVLDDSRTEGFQLVSCG